MSDIIIYQPSQTEISAAVQIIMTAHPQAAQVPPQVIEAAALLALQVGANPNPLAGELSIYEIRGKFTPYLGIAYYRRIAEETGARVAFAPQENADGYHGLSNEPRMMTPEERQRYGVPDNTLASICKGFRGDRLVELIDKGVPWRDAAAILSRVGVGFIRDDEMRGKDGKYFNPPNGRSWQWKCDKRAETDLYKKLGVVARHVDRFQMDAADKAQAAEIEPPADRPRYTLEQLNEELF